jgi:hypothetical protein
MMIACAVGTAVMRYKAHKNECAKKKDEGKFNTST